MSAQSVVAELSRAIEYERKIGNLLTQVRRIDESDERTLLRLIHERRQLINLLRELKIHAELFDHDFLDWLGPVAKLREHLRLGPDETDTSYEDAKADYEAGDYQHAERMSVLWAQRALELKQKG